MDGGFIFLMILLFTVWIGFKILGKTFKIVAKIGTIMSILFFGFGILMYMDVQDVKNNFGEQDKLFLMESDYNIITGIIIKEMEISGFPPLVSNLEKLNNNYNIGNKKAMLGGYYKYFLYHESFFSDVDSLELGDFSITYDQAISIIKSNDALKDATELFMEKKEIPIEGKSGVIDELKSSENVKGMLFTSLISEKMNNPSVLITGLKSGELEIYPETISFKVLKLLPEELLSKLVEVGQ